MHMQHISLLTVVGARPQFVKAAMLSRAIAARNAARPGGPEVRETIVHTGQHYDHAMSQVFFDELDIDQPSVNLGVGSGTHGAQTALMLQAVEEVLLRDEPDAVIVYGDTNSTLAAALAASKIHVPVCHVEAGLRSFNKAMPEEINRLVTDHLSTLLFCPTRHAVDNLRRESVVEGVHDVGDVMYDSLLHYRDRIEHDVRALEPLGVEPGDYVVATVHRPHNADDKQRLGGLLDAMAGIGRSVPLLLVLHPRTRRRIRDFGLDIPDGVRAVEPVSYLSMLQLQAHALGVVTDSGGMQKEAFILGKPCLTLRGETEWTETLENEANVLAGDDLDAFPRWFERLAAARREDMGRILPYGDGHAADRILECIVSHFGA